MYCPETLWTDPPPPPRPVERAREDFPVLQQVVNGRPLAYLDNAATTQKPAVVIRALCEYYGTCNANVHRAFHALGAEATRRYEAARATVARFTGAPSPDGVVFTSGATMAINLVAHGWGRKFVRPDDTILLTGMEHHSNLVPWQILARERGARLAFVPVLPDGQLDQEAYRRLLSERRVALAAFTHASNVLGTVNPVAAMAKAAREAGARVLIDAAQSLPQRPIHFGELGCDFLVFSGHKACGPTGVGALVARPELLETMDPFLTGGDMIDLVTEESATWAGVPARFEAGTPNVSGVIGLGVALDYLSALGMDAVTARERALTAALLERLADIRGLRVFGSAPDRTGAVSFETAGIHPHDLAQVLDREGVAVRAGHLCAQPLLRRLGVPAVTRASVYFYNTEADLDRLVEGIRVAQKFFGHGS
jgi:cysteine desulfurase/selenocysteine lyase